MASPGREVIIPLTFEKGLYVAERPTLALPGTAAVLNGWQPMPSGALKARQGWKKPGTSADPTGQDVRGVSWLFDPGHSPQEGNFVVLVFSGLDTAIVYCTPDTLNAPWITAESIATWGVAAEMAAADVGNGKLLWNMGKALRHLTLNNRVAAVGAVTNSPLLCTDVCFHRSRFFAGAKQDSVGTYRPGRLYFSEIGESNSWTLGSNFWDVGKDDGGYVWSLCSTEQGIVIGKDNGTLFLLMGDDLTNFELHTLSRSSGVLQRPNMLIPTPYGVVGLDRTKVWLWQGGGEPDDVSGAVKGSLWGGGLFSRPLSQPWYSNDHIYMPNDPSSELLVLNLKTGAWHTEQFWEDAPSAGMNHDGRRVMVGLRATSSPLFTYYRDEPEQAGAWTRDTTPLTERFWLDSPELNLREHGEGPAFIRHIYYKVRQLGGGAGDTSLSGQVFIRDEAGALTGPAAGTFQINPVAAGTDKILRGRIDIGLPAYSVMVRINQTLPDPKLSAFDIERLALGVRFEEAR